MKVRPFGIQLKIFAAFGLFFTMVVAGGGWAVTQYFLAVSRSRIEQRQLEEVALLAQAMDDKFTSYLKAMEAVAGRIPPRALKRSGLARAWIRDRRGIRSTFENGIFLFGPAGQTLAEDAQFPAEIQAPGHLRPLLSSVAARRKPAVSEAYFSDATGQPAFLVAAPFLGEDGRVLAIMAGSIDLAHDDLLSALSQSRAPGSSVLQLLDAKRRVLIRPGGRLRLKLADPSDTKALFDLTLGGGEGSGVWIDSAGVRTISSMKRLRTIGGMLVASVSEDEALRPIERVRSGLKLATAFVVALSLALTWLISHGLADHLEEVTAQVRSLASLPAGDRTIRIQGHDEVSLLAESFNSMIGRLESNEKALLQTQAETDEELAITKHLLHRLVDPGLSALPESFHMETLQTRRINGDACAYREGPLGIHSGLLCDATGHGLAAGVSTMPAVQAFLGMATHNVPLETSYFKINGRLRQMLPPGRFVCLMLLRLDTRKGTLSVLNAGLPDFILLPRQGPPRSGRTRNLPTGVVDRPGTPSVEQIAVSEGDRFFAFTDGLQEALGDRLEALLARLTPAQPFSESLRHIRASLEESGQDQERRDDVSWALWEVPGPPPEKWPEPPDPPHPLAGLGLS